MNEEKNTASSQENEAKNSNTETLEKNNKSKTEPEQTGNAAKYSDADLDKIINRKFAEWKAKEEKAVKEAERLAKMTATEKAEHQMKEAIKRAEEAEAKLNRYALKNEARTILSEAKLNLPEGLLDILVSDDAENTKTRIDEFKKLFTEAVEDAVKAKIAGNPPKTKSGAAARMTKEEIMAIKDPNARRKAIADNLEIFTK